jgi:membrane fusion protein (multidrug efflux system)
MYLMRFLVLIISAFVLLACSEANGGKERGFKDKKETVPVEITSIARGDIEDRLLFNATLQTENKVKVFSRLEGELVSQPLEEGSFVRIGEVLVRIDGREQKLAMEKALINYRQQENEFARIESLYKEELVSREEYDQAQLTLDQSRVEYETAKLNFEYTQIKAPISGVVSKRLINQGDRVAPSMEVFEITNLTEKIAVIYVPENYLYRIKKNLPAYFTSDVMGDAEMLGYVKRISPVIDPTSGTFKVTVAVKDIENRLKPGMFVNVMLVTETHENTVIIPKNALVYDNDRSFFYTVKDDTLARKHLLDRGLEDSEKVEVLNAEVGVGDALIVVGQSGLKDSAIVNIVTRD